MDFELKLSEFQNKRQSPVQGETQLMYVGIRNKHFHKTVSQESNYRKKKYCSQSKIRYYSKTWL